MKSNNKFHTLKGRIHCENFLSGKEIQFQGHFMKYEILL